MENVSLKENKKGITGKYKHIISAFIVCLSLYLASPKTPEFNSMPLVMRPNTYQQTPSSIDNSSSNEDKNSQETLILTERDDPADLTTIPTPYEESNFKNLSELESKITFSPKLNIVGGVLVDIANYPEMGFANGCSTWKAGRLHWITAAHCSAGVGSLVRNEAYSNGRQVTITEVMTYTVFSPVIGIKILKVNDDLPLSSPLAINSNPNALNIGRVATTCGFGNQSLTDGYFPSPLACAVMPIAAVNSYSYGKWNIGRGHPWYGDSGAPETIIDPKTGIRAAIGSQEYLAVNQTVNPWIIRSSGGTNYSYTPVLDFIRANIPDVKLVYMPAEYKIFIPRLRR